MLSVIRKLFPSKHERDVRALMPLVEEINENFEKLKDLSDDELQGKTQEFRARIQEALKETEDRITAVREELKKDLEGAAARSVCGRKGRMPEARRHLV
jgi:preprotein translocase subunit SecA